MQVAVRPGAHGKKKDVRKKKLIPRAVPFSASNPQSPLDVSGENDPLYKKMLPPFSAQYWENFHAVMLMYR